MTDATIGLSPSRDTARTSFAILGAIASCHLMNDLMQSLLSALYPMIKSEFALAFWQIGLLTFCFQVTASLLQPVVGMVTDKKPFPWTLPLGMASTMVGLVTLAFAPSYGLLICGAGLIGIGSSIFHPEASRVTRAAAGTRFGLAQSVFQVGGNFGTAVGPLLAAFIVVPLGRHSVAAFALVALVGMIVLTGVSRWHVRERVAAARRKAKPRQNVLAPRRVALSVTILLVLVFSKQVYMASMTNYFTFFLIDRFDLSTTGAQRMLFLFLAAVAAGTIIGGPVGDRIGRRTVIWVSILGVLPFTLLLPYANLFWTGVLSMVIGVILASALPAIMVFAQDLMPGKVGTVAGLFFGAAFGIAGIAAAGIGALADVTSIRFVFELCSALPVFGLLTIFLPKRQELI
ncbi:MFS transporter [Pseudooceanicola sp. CBS1P-1]|uniref:MFS transporter n=1 Tax=Pseudooceanicola albus TaxID=2692189 RepID=A0A6L7G4V8_9RHOB|nr:MULTISPECIES: MFS transporter [Pseudooceanicola]MBT9383809.1 MFS transporter [Pseudooceanicola endophyticus]MXN17663.1 MFS transporter [Pseudooceanicola albus]